MEHRIYDFSLNNSCGLKIPERDSACYGGTGVRINNISTAQYYIG